jgi:hypothetical protein
VARLWAGWKLGALPSLFDVASHRSGNMSRQALHGTLPLLWDAKAEEAGISSECTWSIKLCALQRPWMMLVVSRNERM